MGSTITIPHNFDEFESYKQDEMYEVKNNTQNFDTTDNYTKFIVNTINKPSNHSNKNPNNESPKKIKKPIHILIVESDPDILELFKTIFENYKLSSTDFDNGSDALHRFTMDFLNNNDNKKYDIVIIDTHLKDIHGLEIVKKIRQMNPSQKIIVTSTTLPENLPKDLLDYSRIEENDILVKPFKLSKLLSIIYKKCRQ